jgi:hypothetical protein
VCANFKDKAVPNLKKKKNPKTTATFRTYQNMQEKFSQLFGTGVLHLIQINHQPDATVFQFVILAFGRENSRNMLSCKQTSG